MSSKQGCSGECNQGRKKCETPEACEISSDDRDPLAQPIMVVVMLSLMCVCAYSIWLILGGVL